MDAQVEGALATVMPQYCDGTVSDAEVTRWYEDNGFGEPPAQNPAQQPPL